MSAVSNRRARVDALLETRRKIDAELEAIENQIRDEMAAMQLAKTAARAARIKPRRKRIAHCGTDGGYYRHRRTLGEPACEACKLAHRVAEAERVARRLGSQWKAS